MIPKNGDRFSENIMRKKRCIMTINGWLQICILFRGPHRDRRSARPLHDPRLRRRAHIPVAGAAAGRGCSLSNCRCRRKTRAELDHVYGGMLLFHAAGFVLVYAMLRLQAILPFNPADQSAVPADLTFNTAVSFITNTNWQNYGGESTLSYLTQMLGLTTQNFVSAATGIALLIALIRAFARASTKTVGNFWVDITRCDALRAVADSAIVAALIPRLAGRAAEPRRLCRCHHAGRRQANARRSGRLADRDQAARHQWRRLLECQFGRSVRESDGLSQFP